MQVISKKNKNTIFEMMVRNHLIIIVLTLLSTSCFSQIYSEENQTFVYQNRIKYQISTEEIDGKFEQNVFLKLSIYKNGEYQKLKTIKIDSEVQDADLLTFGEFIDKTRRFLLIKARYHFYILNLYNNKVLGPYSPKFLGVGQDAQSGMITDLKIIMQGRFLIGYCVDSGTFLFDLTHLYQSFEAVSANIPHFHENHVYIFNRADNNQKHFGLFIYSKNWKVNSKLIFNNKTIILKDNSYIFNLSETETEEQISDDSRTDYKYTILKEESDKKEYSYIVIDNDTGNFVDIPLKILKSNKSAIVNFLEKQ